MAERRWIGVVDRAYGVVEHAWEHPATQRRLATAIILLFLGSLLVIELALRGIVPLHVRSHFTAVDLVFTSLLFIEVLGLVFGLVGSIANAMGKQLEILSLIMLRQAFKRFAYFDEPLHWNQVQESVLYILSDAGGALLLFVVLGAPDLALTQVACETLSVVVFLLVLRMLPERFEHSTPAVRVVPRLVLSVAVGLFCVGLTVAAAGSRTANPVSDEMVDRARPDGHGNNVVNVVLVDIRGMDTLGEVTVLVTAGIGVAALARAGRRPPPRRPWTAGHPDGLPRAGRRRRTESVPDVDGVSS